MNIEEISKNISREELEEMYSNQLLSKDEIRKHFNLCNSTLSKLIKMWGLKRDCKAFNERKALKSASSRSSPYKSFSKAQVELLKDLYLNKNYSYMQIREYFQLSGYTLDKILRENNIRKDKSIAARTGFQTKCTKAGSKESYDKHIRELQKKSYAEKYGSLENYYKLIGDKCREAWYSKSPTYKDSRIAHMRDVYLSCPDKLEAAKKKRVATNLIKYGIDNSYKLASYKSLSQPNRDFAVKLESLGISYSSEFRLAASDCGVKSFRYDFKVDRNLVEINPWPFHNISFTPVKNSSPIEKDYHLKKSQVAKTNGYRCIHVFDWDNPDKIINSLVPRATVYARKCRIEILSEKDTIEFLTSHHFQGSCKNQAVKLGLYYEDRLLQVMTFGKPRYNRNYEWELLRLCTLPGYMVVGGAEKLFKYFVNKYSPSSIISYCDLSKFTGDVYTKLGMKLISTSRPTRHWYHPKLHEHVTDNFLRQRGFDQLYGKLFGMYGKGTSNEELMLEHGFVEIYDCGQASYGWKKLT